MNLPMIITIDGPVGTGKSTIAKLLAERLDFVHVDTGAMYRALTYGVIKHNINTDQPEALDSLLTDFHLQITTEGRSIRYFFESEDITETIRGEHVTFLVSKVSAIAAVRKKLVELQRELGIGRNTVFEGRDMGTHVFPNAELKIFLTATPEIRAKRRFDELKQKFPADSLHLTYDEVLKSVMIRDHQDSTREISPLKKAEDAHLIDTSHLSIDEILNRIVAIKKKI